MSVVRESKKATVETAILKQLEYITKDYIAMQTILF